MDDALPVRLVERIGDRDRVAERLGERERTLRQPIGQRLAVQMFHHEKVGTCVAADVVNRADVRMVQARERLRLALEARLERGVRGDVIRQHLDRHGAPQARVGGLVHFAHATGAEGRSDFVGAEPCTWRECHWLRILREARR
jgi:hypothetical protein